MSAVLESPSRLDSQARPPYPVRRWTVREYQRLAKLGVLTPDDRVELLEGWIVPKMTHYPPHAWALLNAERVLKPLLGTDWHARAQLPIETSDSEPEPDQAVVRGPMESYLHRHPTQGEIALIIEVADASLRKDRKKARIYASIGVPVYWIINLVDRQIEVHSTPDAKKRQYQELRILAPSDPIALTIDGRTLGEFTVNQFLPPIDSTDSLG